MRMSILIGIFLIVLGVISLAYQGITYASEKEVVQLGPIEAKAETKEQIPLPPVLGVAALAGGVVLVAVGAQESRSI